MSKRTVDQNEPPAKRFVPQTFQTDQERLKHLVDLAIGCAFEAILPPIQTTFLKYDLFSDDRPLSDSYIVKSSLVCTALKFILTLNPVLYINLTLEHRILTDVYNEWGYGSLPTSMHDQIVHLRFNLDVLASIEAGFKDVCVGYSGDVGLAFVDPIPLSELMNLLYSHFHKRIKPPYFDQNEFERKSLEMTLNKLRDLNSVHYTKMGIKYKSTGKSLGGGSFGEVWEVETSGNKQRAALKTTVTKLDKGSGIDGELVREIVLLNQFATGENKNVVRLLDTAIYLNLDDNTVRISYIMPLYLTFSHVRRQHKHHFESPRLIESLSMQLLIGVAYLHDRNVVHGDLKPDNLLVEEVPEHGIVIKITDFNLSRFWMDRRFDDAYNGTFHDVVTLWYRSPELMLQSRPHPIVLHSSIDIWSVALIIIYMQNGVHWLREGDEYDCLLTIFSRLGLPGRDSYLQSFRRYNNHRYDSNASISRPANDPTYFDKTYSAKEVLRQKALVRKMLAYDPRDRPSAQECLFDVYFLNASYWNQLSLT
jgi:hypothetical protein